MDIESLFEYQVTPTNNNKLINLKNWKLFPKINWYSWEKTINYILQKIYSLVRQLMHFLLYKRLDGQINLFLRRDLSHLKMPTMYYQIFSFQKLLLPIILSQSKLVICRIMNIVDWIDHICMVSHLSPQKIQGEFNDSIENECF